MEKATLDTEEAANYLGVSPWFLRKDRTGLRIVPFTRIGRRCLYLKQDLDAVLQKGRVERQQR
jgi:hypothetical protein